MQSGISASEELASQFGTLLASDTHFGLLATIRAEKLVPLTLLTPSSPGQPFGELVTQLLTPHIKPNEALYIILRRYDAAPRLVAVTYVPDTAPVRQKMLFAATRLTLVRELGSEHFRDTVFATSPEELTAAGFERHDKHAALAAPLTEEERTLGDVKRAEQEAGSGTGSKELHLGQKLAISVADDALASLKNLASTNDSALVMLKINPESESIELVPGPGTVASIADLSSAISSTEPRFSFYRFAHSHGGSDSAPILFLYTCPATAGSKAIKNRMIYPLMKRSVLEVATKEAGLEIAKKFEVEEPSEITEDTILGELHPKVQTRQGFSRPKRPGR